MGITEYLRNKIDKVKSDREYNKQARTVDREIKAKKWKAKREASDLKKSQEESIRSDKAKVRSNQTAGIRRTATSFQSGLNTVRSELRKVGGDNTARNLYTGGSSNNVYTQKGTNVFSGGGSQSRNVFSGGKQNKKRKRKGRSIVIKL